MPTLESRSARSATLRSFYGCLGILMGSGALLACSSPAVPGTTPGSPADPGGSTSDAGRVPDSGVAPGNASTPDGGAAAACAVRPACDAPLPDLGAAREFHRLESKAAALAAPQHRGRDLFLLPGQDAWALGKFSYLAAVDKDIHGEDIDVYLLRDCGTTWTKLPKSYKTSFDNAPHPTVEGVEDTGGRIYVNLTQEGVAPLGIGRHRILMVVAGDLTTTDQFIEVLPPNAKIVVSDVDGTLTSSEYAAAGDLVGRPAEAHPGAADMMKAFAERGYYLFYLTARPEWMTHFSRDWFPLHGFPPGILHTTLTIEGAIGAGAARYKIGELAALKSRVGITPSYGFGNKDSDVTAYTASGLTPAHCQYYQLGSDLKGGVRNDDYRTLIPMAQGADLACR